VQPIPGAFLSFQTETLSTLNSSPFHPFSMPWQSYFPSVWIWQPEKPCRSRIIQSLTFLSLSYFTYHNILKVHSCFRIPFLSKVDLFPQWYVHTTFYTFTYLSMDILPCFQILVIMNNTMNISTQIPVPSLAFNSFKYDTDLLGLPQKRA
jgi:hypothetical protein